MKIILLLTILAVFAKSSFATEASKAKIIRLDLAKSYGSVLIKLNTSTPIKASCHQNTGWDYVMPISSDIDKTMFSILLAAYMSGKSITIAGSDACSQPLVGAVETAVRVTLEE